MRGITIKLIVNYEERYYTLNRYELASKYHNTEVKVYYLEEDYTEVHVFSGEQYLGAFKENRVIGRTGIHAINKEIKQVLKTKYERVKKVAEESGFAEYLRSPLSITSKNGYDELALISRYEEKVEKEQAEDDYWQDKYSIYDRWYDQNFK